MSVHWSENNFRVIRSNLTRNLHCGIKNRGAKISMFLMKILGQILGFSFLTQYRHKHAYIHMHTQRSEHTRTPYRYISTFKD